MPDMPDRMFPPATRETHQRRSTLAPEVNTAFREFSEEVFAQGVLSKKTKQLMAVAAGHVTQCPYCIRGHTQSAQDAGATREEIMEAIWVAATLRADGVHTHADQTFENLSQEDRAALAPGASDAFHAFTDRAFAGGSLSEQQKRLLAVTVAHATRSESCISNQVERARDLGASDEELMEAIWVAVEMQTGGATAHATIALDVMEDPDT
jgi:AhpD family alkylhydroperoxidase